MNTVRQLLTHQNGNEVTLKVGDRITFTERGCTIESAEGTNYLFDPSATFGDELGLWAAPSPTLNQFTSRMIMRLLSSVTKMTFVLERSWVADKPSVKFHERYRVVNIPENSCAVFDGAECDATT